MDEIKTVIHNDIAKTKFVSSKKSNKVNKPWKINKDN